MEPTTVYYARSRSLFRIGSQASDQDRQDMLDTVLKRLQGDIDDLQAGRLATSPENPLFL